MEGVRGGTGGEKERGGEASGGGGRVKVGRRPRVWVVGEECNRLYSLGSRSKPLDRQ